MALTRRYDAPAGKEFWTKIDNVSDPKRLNGQQSQEAQGSNKNGSPQPNQDSVKTKSK